MKFVESIPLAFCKVSTRYLSRREIRERGGKEEDGKGMLGNLTEYLSPNPEI